MNHEEIIRKAKNHIILNHTFFSFLLLSLKMKAVADGPLPNGGDTMVTDGESIWYKPEFVESMTVKEAVGLLMHEVAHIAHSHHLRIGSRELERWNEAADHQVNLSLKKAGIEVPPVQCADERFQGQSVENIYTQLPVKPKKPEGGGQGQGQGKGKKNGPGNYGEIMAPKGKDGKALSQEEMERRQQENSNNVRLAARQAGTQSGFAQLFLEDIYKSPIDWRAELQHLVSQCMRFDYSYMRPNRRYMPFDIYNPSMVQQTLPKFVAIIDTSGSISQEMLKQFAGELEQILTSWPGLELTVIYCDAQVQHVDEFTPQDVPLKLKIYGGGGTDFVPPFNWIDKHLEQPPVGVVYMTDLYCSSFPKEPEYPVIWACISDQTNNPWGTRIKLDITG